jgi:uncharacterized membrane protein
MITTEFIIIARILHIASSTVWAGFVIIAGFVLVNTPRSMKPEEARRVRQNAVGRAARVVGPAAVISLLSGVYLSATLHAGSRTPTEIALAVGALSAILSFFVGAIGSGVPDRQLAKLDELSTRSPTDTKRIAALNRRVILSARVTAGLLLFSVVAMAAARFL